MQIKATHFIDTAVFLESLDPRRPKQADICKKYLTRINKVYRGVISVPVLGEYTKVVISKPMGDSFDVFHFLVKYIKTTKVKIITPDFKILRKFNEIMNWKLDQRIGSMDRLHLACAEVIKVNNFVTIENTILKNRRLKDLLKVKLTHPKNLL